MATSRVSRAIKMEKEIGFIKQGYPAVFTVFDDNLKKAETFIYKWYVILYIKEKLKFFISNFNILRFVALFHTIE